jgi:hypothetical protein
MVRFDDFAGGVLGSILVCCTFYFFFVSYQIYHLDGIMAYGSHVNKQV